MSDTVIRVENLSKSAPKGLPLRHQSGERYTALRDVLTNGVKSVASSVLRGARVPLGRGLRVGNAPPPPATRHSPPTTEEFWALNDVSFEVKQGERVGIIGRNGAGKSTLLKILSRITEPTKGSIHIKGRVASLLEVGTGFHPELTGRENIYLNGAILGMSRAEIRRKFEEMVAFALPSFSDYRIIAGSGRKTQQLNFGKKFCKCGRITRNMIQRIINFQAAVSVS